MVADNLLEAVLSVVVAVTSPPSKGARRLIADLYPGAKFVHCRVDHTFDYNPISVRPKNVLLLIWVFNPKSFWLSEAWRVFPNAEQQVMDGLL